MAARKAPKGTPTDLNMSVFDSLLTKGGGLIERMDTVDIPHMRRILDAGYLAQAPGAKRGVWVASQEGIEALLKWRAAHSKSGLARGRAQVRTSRPSRFGLAGGFSGFDLFDDVEPASEQRPRALDLQKQLGAAYSHPASRLLDEKVLDQLSSPILLHFVSSRAWAVEAKPGVDLHKLGPKLFRSLVGKRSLTSSDPFLHDMRLFLVGNQGTIVFEPPTKAKKPAGKAFGRYR